ncbi:MAG: START domain-containing protein [bacterium]
MRRFHLISVFFLLPWSAMAATAAPTPNAAAAALDEPAFSWQKPSQSDGILIYWSKVPNTGIVAFKGEGIVDAPLDKVATIIVDTSRGTEWIDGLVESRVLRSISPTQFIEYDHQGVPFPFDQFISDRDFVSKVTVETMPDVHGLTIRYTSTTDPSMPPLKKYVRGDLRYCVFKLTPMSMPGQTYVVAEVDADPKGHLAPWLVNFFQEGWPHTTFLNLRKEAKKTDIKPFAWIDQLIASTGPFVWNPPPTLRMPTLVKKKSKHHHH